MKKEAAWGYAAQFLQYGAALLVLPLLLKQLSSAEMGVWYVFLTVSSLVVMLDMGFSPTLARNVSYVLGGAKRLFRDGHDIVQPDGEVDYGLLKAVIHAARVIFLWMTALVFMGLLTLGTWFVFFVAQGQIPVLELTVSWGAFVVGTAINVYFKYYTPLLQGRGLFAGYYKATAISNIGFVLATAILVWFGAGLIGVTIGYLVSALLSRWLCRRYFFDDAISSRLQVQMAPIPPREIAATLWSNSWRLGLVVVGAFLSLRFNTLLASAYLGLAATAQYALTLQVFSALVNTCMVAVTIQQQKLAHCRVMDNKSELRRLTMVGQAGSVLLYVATAPFLVLFGNELIAWSGSHTALLEWPLLAVVAAMYLAELNHSGSSVMIVTRNTVPFYKAAVISGVAIALSTWVGLAVFHFGVWWPVATQLVIQAAYNNWKWPTVLAAEFRISYSKLLLGGARLLLGSSVRSALSWAQTRARGRQV